VAWAGTVRATSATGATFEAATDADGSYEIRLPDGTYTVAPVTTGPATARPVTVTVSGSMQAVDLLVDTGIR
jgi:hypothetical protein